VTDFQRFRSLLKRRYGVTPADVGIDSEMEYQLAHANDDPRGVVDQLARKYGLKTLKETNT